MGVMTIIYVKIIDSYKHYNPLIFSSPEEAIEYLRKKYGIVEEKGNGSKMKGGMPDGTR
jgi:hypothetical protein